MSIYSGFSTRNQEKVYSRLCEELVRTIADRAIKAMSAEPSDDSLFSKTVISLYRQMAKMELHKYLPPKLSQCCSKLAIFCVEMFPFYQEDAKEVEKLKRFDYQLPDIYEMVEKKGRKGKKYSAENGKRERENGRGISSRSNYEKIEEKLKGKSRMKKKEKEEEGRECVELSDGMFYRL
jgi:hypothetical protein